MTSKQTRDSARTRQSILRAAEKEFAGKGFYGARIDRIAELAQTNKRMIYEYYGNKEDLYRTVLIKVYSRLGEQEVNLLTQNMDCTEAIIKLIRLHFDFLRDNPSYVSLLLWENLNQGRYFDSDEIRGVRDSALQQIRKIIHKGKEQGVFRKEADEDQFLLSLLTFSFPYFSNRYTLSQLLSMPMELGEDLDKRVAHVTEMLLLYLLNDTK